MLNHLDSWAGAFLVTALFTANLILLALFTLVAAKAFMMLATAWSHVRTAREYEETIIPGRKAVRDLRARSRGEPFDTENTTDDDIAEAIRLENELAAERAAGAAIGEEEDADEREVTTTANEHLEEEGPIPVDSFYAKPDEEP